MATYHVTFERPVIYLPDHRLRSRELTELDVNTDGDGQAAIAHALRVTRGDGGAVTARLIAEQGERRQEPRA